MLALFGFLWDAMKTTRQELREVRREMGEIRGEMGEMRREISNLTERVARIEVALEIFHPSKAMSEGETASSSESALARSGGIAGSGASYPGRTAIGTDLHRARRTVPSAPSWSAHAAGYSGICARCCISLRERSLTTKPAKHRVAVVQRRASLRPSSNLAIRDTVRHRNR